MPRWNALLAAGADLNVRAGCPHGIERIEGGFLSYGNDMTDDNTPHECGLGRFCNTQSAVGCIGRDALLRVAKEGPVQQIRALAIAGPRVPGCDKWWPVTARGETVGRVGSAGVVRANGRSRFGQVPAGARASSTHASSGGSASSGAPVGATSPLQVQSYS